MYLLIIFITKIEIQNVWFFKITLLNSYSSGMGGTPWLTNHEVVRVSLAPRSRWVSTCFWPQGQFHWRFAQQNICCITCEHNKESNHIWIHMGGRDFIFNWKIFCEISVLFFMITISKDIIGMKNDGHKILSEPKFCTI